MRQNLDLKTLCNDYTKFAINNEKLFSGVNYSTIQYCNISVCRNHNRVSAAIHNFLSLYKNKTFLNIGMGPGFLENRIAISKSVQMDSVEWENQVQNFEPILKHFDIKDKLTYTCNDITKDNFEIYNCNKTYDYLLLVRFFPLNAANATLEQTKERLNKLKKYSNKIFLFDIIEENYTNEQVEYFASIGENTPLGDSILLTL
tara:strand:- start:114 stop:719 length:606 start_codon:yes stop_codon:yes gene_type:complete